MSTTVDIPTRNPGEPIKWYRPKISKEDLQRLNKKNDFLGLCQTVGFLAIIATSGTVFVWSCFNQPWLAVPLLFLHGFFMNFLINGFHELVHESVFKSKRLNQFFLHIYSFLGNYNHVGFWASHMEHHRFTLHPPDDYEVTQPEFVERSHIYKWGIVNYMGIIHHFPSLYNSAFGALRPGWETTLFTEKHPEMRPAFHRWTKIVLFGHLAIVIASLATGYWPILFAVTFPRAFGAAPHYLINVTQHIGLQDQYPDFRVCCRTIYLNPFLQFLYWHMNFHTEHHMFAGVPCYNLPKLHKLIKHELPPTSNGLISTWRQINRITKQQKEDPTYRYFPELPTERSH